MIEEKHERTLPHIKWSVHTMQNGQIYHRWGIIQYISTSIYFDFLIFRLWFITDYSRFMLLFKIMCVCVCVFQCQPTRLLRASGSTQGKWMALSVVYFWIMHHLGRPNYVWDEYLYSVLEKVEVRVIVCIAVCVIVLCRMMMMKGREKVKPGSGS